MKIKFIFSAISVAVLCMGMANGQITPSTQRASLSENDRAILNHHLSNYTAFTIDLQELVNYLYGNGGIGQFRLRIDEDLDWTIDLELNDMRAFDYRATYTTDNDGISKPNVKIAVKSEETLANWELFVYPNPTNDLLRVDITGGDIPPDASVEIFAVNGAKKGKWTGISPTNTIDISTYPTGVYLLRVELDKENVIVRKIVKNNN